MTARNHVEAANARKARRPPQKPSYTMMVALAGQSVSEAAAVLIRRLRGGMEVGDLHLSGSEDMVTAARDALVKLEQAVRVFDDVGRKPT